MPADLIKRPPIAVLLGHIDHGKTSILDKIRSTHLREREEGLITQTIRACQIQHQNHKITFLDTPGHHAFAEMRSRGAKITDIAVLVIDASEGVKEQTQECIQLIRQNKIPAVIALNKIDLVKEKFQLEKIKKDLGSEKMVIEEWGGDIPLVPLSAKTGEGIDDLLEMILVLAETLDLKANPQGNLLAVVLESEINDRKGVITTLLIQNGTLHIGDEIFSENSAARIKAILKTVSSQKISKAGPGLPVQVLGLKQTSPPGTIFSHKKIILSSNHKTKKLNDLIHQISQKNKDASSRFNLLLKADTFGSLEALLSVLFSISSSSKKISLNILSTGIGQINQEDINKADLTHSAIFGFKVKPTPPSLKQAKEKKIKLKTFSVIFKLKAALLKDLKKALPVEYEEKPLGMLKVLAVFKVEKSNQIIGGKVAQGELEQGALFKVEREGQTLPQEMRILSLEQNKKAQKKVKQGLECGLRIEGPVKIQPGDLLKVFEKIEQEKKLRL